MRSESGFTLLEVLIAFSILALVVTAVLAIRTGGVIDATEARNWRVARELAQEILSELKAGAREEPPSMDLEYVPIPKLKDVEGWTHMIVIGEENIATVEGHIDEAKEANTNDDDSAGSATDRREFQRERDDLRRARQRGMSFYEYREKSQLEEQDRLEREEAPPSEDEFEEVAVVVRFPNPRWPNNGGEFSFFVLKARLSTLAIEGLTPEEAETVAGDDGGTAGGTAGDPGSSEGSGK